MAKALEYPAIFKVLLDGGYICESQQAARRSTAYELYQPDSSPRPAKYVGHITQKQFEQLAHHGVIGWSGWPNRMDKYGTVTIYYGLQQEKDGDEK